MASGIPGALLKVVTGDGSSHLLPLERPDEFNQLVRTSWPTDISMHPTGITANLSVADLAEARDFYMGFLGLSVEDSTWAGSSTCILQTAALSSS